MFRVGVRVRGMYVCLGSEIRVRVRVSIMHKLLTISNHIQDLCMYVCMYVCMYDV